MVIVSLSQKYTRMLMPFARLLNPTRQSFRFTLLFHYKRITSLKNHLSLGQGESLPYRIRGNFCDRAYFELPVEKIYFVCFH